MPALYYRIIIILASTLLLSGCVSRGADAHFKPGGDDTDRSQPNEVRLGRDRAIPRNSDPARVYKDQGAVYASLGRHQRAVENFAQAISLDPRFAEAYYF